MADISIVPLSLLRQEDRWEAEFYQSKYNLPSTPNLKWAPIGDILEECQYGSSLVLNEDGKGYPIFRLNEIENGLLTKPEKHVEMSQQDYESLRLKVDDILFCRTNGNFNLVGRTGMLKEPFDACFASYLVRVRPQRDVILPEYLTVYLMSSIGLNQIRRRAMRSIQVNVSASQLKRIPIPLADRAFQERVANLFNKHATLILEARRQYSDALQILSCNLGLDKLDLSHPIGYEAWFSEILAAQRFDSEYFKPKYKHLRELITQFAPLHLGDICRIRKGIEVGGAAYVDEGILFIRVSTLTPLGVCPGPSEKYISAELYSSFNHTYRPRLGEILLSKDGTPGIAHLVDQEIEGIISGGVVRLDEFVGINPSYLEAVINSTVCQLQIEQESSGALIAHWKPNKIRRLLIPRLKASMENRIAELVLQAKKAHRKAGELLEKAKRRVEDMIEKEAGK